MRRFLLIISILSVVLLAGCAAQSTTSYKHIDAPKLKKWLDENKDIFLVDVHIPEQQHIKDTDAFIPFNEVKQNASKFPKDKNATVVVYCAGGHMGDTAAQYLIELGYKEVYNLDRGMADWLSKNYPLQD